MRTTLTIDDDLAGILQRKARELDKPFKELVNTALRKGLAENLTEKKRKIIVRLHDFGSIKAGLDMERINQLADELEVEEYLRKAAKDDAAGH
jgi:ClpP class serine protease